MRPMMGLASVTLLLLVGCGDSDCPTPTQDAGSADFVQNQVGGFRSLVVLEATPVVAKALEETGFPLNKGDTPPYLGGQYYLDPAVGRLALLDQFGVVNICPTDVGLRFSGSPRLTGPYVVGSGTKFTMWAEWLGLNDSGSACALHHLILWSGEKLQNGDLLLKELRITLGQSNCQAPPVIGEYAASEEMTVQRGRIPTGNCASVGQHDGLQATTQAPAGQMVLRLPGQPVPPSESVQCGALLDGRPYITLHVNGTTEGDYLHFDGPLAQLPAGAFKAVITDRYGGAFVNPQDAIGGWLSISNASVISGVFALQVAGNELMNGFFRTQPCDFTP